MEWEGVGTNEDGNGNDRYSYVKKFPRIFTDEDSLGCRLILYLLVFGIFILKDDCRHFCFIFKVLWKVF